MVVYQALWGGVMGKAREPEALQWKLRLGIERESAEQTSDQHAELEAVAGETRRDDDSAPARMVVKDEVFVGGDVVHTPIYALQSRLRRARNDRAQEITH